MNFALNSVFSVSYCAKNTTDLFLDTRPAPLALLCLLLGGSDALLTLS